MVLRHFNPVENMPSENFSTFVAATADLSPIVGTEPIPVVSGGTTKHFTLNELVTWLLPQLPNYAPGGSALSLQANSGTGGFTGSPAVLLTGAGIHIHHSDGSDLQFDIETGGDGILLKRPGGILFFQVNPYTRTFGIFGATPIGQQVANDLLSDSTGGTPATIIAAVAGTGDDADINNNFASLTAQLDKIRSLLTSYGLGS